MYNLVGYITPDKAIEFGFTNHGKYFGIPCWLAEETDGAYSGMMVAAKRVPMEYVFSLAIHVEQLLRDMFYPEEDPGFQFEIGPEIKREKEINLRC